MRLTNVLGLAAVAVVTTVLGAGCTSAPAEKTGEEAADLASLYPPLAYLKASNCTWYPRTNSCEATHNIVGYEVSLGYSGTCPTLNQLAPDTAQTVPAVSDPNVKPSHAAGTPVCRYTVAPDAGAGEAAALCSSLVDQFRWNGTYDVSYVLESDPARAVKNGYLSRNPVLGYINGVLMSTSPTDSCKPPVVGPVLTKTIMTGNTGCDTCVPTNGGKVIKAPPLAPIGIVLGK